ncbi:MAG: putative Zn-dependent hydrolase [Candidatus Saccharibacteria bacterium]|nr:putative Zn-dependent hydrolase [Candidatus Saccharibacteria bacterium]
MHLTKYEHACFVVEKDGKVLIVDPGGLTTDFIMPEDEVVAVVVTHEHPDHLDIDQLTAIADVFPKAVFIGPRDVTAKLKNFETRTVKGGDNFIIDGIELEFFGDDHAAIHPSWPLAQNVGVMVDERIYYPGDSFVVPEKSVDTLALPLGAPWLKVSEAVDFMLAVAPRFAFPTHDAVLSHEGQSFHGHIISTFAKDADIDFRRIDGETIEIN